MASMCRFTLRKPHSPLIKIWSNSSFSSSWTWRILLVFWLKQPSPPIHTQNVVQAMCVLWHPHLWLPRRITVTWTLDHFHDISRNKYNMISNGIWHEWKRVPSILVQPCASGLQSCGLGSNTCLQIATCRCDLATFSQKASLVGGRLKFWSSTNAMWHFCWPYLLPSWSHWVTSGLAMAWQDESCCLFKHIIKGTVDISNIGQRMPAWLQHSMASGLWYCDGKGNDMIKQIHLCNLLQPGHDEPELKLLAGLSLSQLLHESWPYHASWWWHPCGSQLALGWHQWQPM